MFSEKLIDRNSPIPIYYQIYKIIRQAIDNDHIKSGEILSSENTLQEMFNVSRISIRNALDILEKEDYIEKSQGKGTLVLSRDNPTNWTSLLNFTNDLHKKGSSLNSIVLGINKVIPEKKILELLNLQDDDYVYHLKRIRLSNNNRVALTISYIVPWVKTDLTKVGFNEKTSLREVMFKENIIFDTCDETIEAIDADNDVCRLLELEFGHKAVFYRERVSYDQFNRPIEFLVGFYNPKYCKYYIEDRKVSGEH